MHRNRLAAPASLLLVLAFATLAPAVAARAARAPGPRAALADVMRKQPYLIYPGVPSQMQALWQLTATATSTIEWGTDTTYGGGSASSDEYGADHQHAYTISGLAPSTKYVYRVTTDGLATTGSFTSAAAPGAQQLKFLAYGDTRTNPATHDQVAAAMISAFTADPAYQTLTLFMGDFVGDGSDESSWTDELFSPAYADIRALQANVPLQACMGNHEDVSPVLYTKYFPYPWVAGRYWSFDDGPIHVTVIDQYTSYAAGSAQLQWVAADLAATTRTWRFLLLHEPGWSSGDEHEDDADVQTLLQPLCERYGVAIVFAGHNHNYCRAIVNGVTHVTTGGGGAPLTEPLAGRPDVVASAMRNHFCKVAIDGDVLRFEAIASADGALIDSFTLVRGAGDHTPPHVRVTSPVGGEAWTAGSTHVVTWDATDDAGVGSVDVECSFGGLAGPWYPVARGIANSGALSWVLPGQPTDSALVRVTARDLAHNVASARSDSVFRIVDPGAGVDGSGAAPLELARPRPNPSEGSTQFRFSLPRSGRARLEILDLGGRRRWQTESEFGAGPHAWSWDGHDARGDRVGAGLYFARLVTPWGDRTARFVRLR